MEIKGEYQIGSSRQAVWDALIDPEMLQKCIPGCESLEKVGDNEYKAKVMAAIGPVRARFDTRLSLENLKPPESYTLTGESKAGMAGFGRGSAEVRLEENDGGTLLTYSADFKVGGKLAQVGSRLVMGATKKTADDFFGTFSRELDPGAMRMDIDAAAGGGVSSMTWKQSPPPLPFCCSGGFCYAEHLFIVEESHPWLFQHRHSKSVVFE